MDFAYTLSGFAVGFIVGLTGVGGGSLMTPLLVLLFHVHPATAVGTDLLYASITKAGGSWAHARRGTVDWKIVGWLALGSVPAAVLTLLVLRNLGVDHKHFTAVITTTLGVALILTALALLFKEKLQKLAKLHDKDILHTKRLTIATVAVGIILGILVTVSSVGAGALGVVALFFLYPRVPTVRIVGTDIAHAVPLTAVAGIGHATMGTVDFTLLGSLLLGSLPGIYLGSMLANKIPERVLRPILALMLILIGGKFVL
jgi:uncharacterized membrane protein YfcA